MDLQHKTRPIKNTYTRVYAQVRGQLVDIFNEFVPSEISRIIAERAEPAACFIFLLRHYGDCYYLFEGTERDLNSALLAIMVEVNNTPSVEYVFYTPLETYCSCLKADGYEDPCGACGATIERKTDWYIYDYIDRCAYKRAVQAVYNNTFVVRRYYDSVAQVCDLTTL